MIMRAILSLAAVLFLYSCNRKCDKVDGGHHPLSLPVVVLDGDSNQVFDPENPNMLTISRTEIKNKKGLDYEIRIDTFPNSNTGAIDYLLRVLAWDLYDVYEDGDVEEYYIHYKDTSIIDTITLHYSVALYKVECIENLPRAHFAYYNGKLIEMTDYTDFANTVLR